MTVLAALMVAALVTVTLGGVKIGSVVVARHRAQSAADLAALAAAQRLPGGLTAACRQAEALAGAMRARVIACTADQLEVTVMAVVAVAGWPGAQARAVARAGPVGPD